MFKQTIVFFIEALLEDDGQAVRNISRKYNISRKKLWQEISQINEVLVTIDADPFLLSEGILLISEEFKKNWSEIKKSLTRKEVFFKEERLQLMVLYVFIRKELVSVGHFQELLQLSKNSVLEEVKRLKILAADYQLQFHYTRQSGYHFIGSENQIRKLVEQSIAKLLEASTGEWGMELVFSLWGKSLNINDINRILVTLTQDQQITFVEERLLEILYLFAFVKEQVYLGHLKYTKKTIKEISEQPLYLIGKRLTSEILLEKRSEEIIFFTIRLLGAVQGNHFYMKDDYLREINHQVIQRVQVLMGTRFISLEQIEHSLLEHLIPAYFRIMFDLPIGNLYTAEIKKQYPELFYLVKKGLAPFENYLGKRIPENEIAFFTIHFGGQLDKIESKQPKLHALALCPNGISSSLILTSNLKEIFPTIEFHRVHQLDLAKEIDDSEYDLIFSTTYYPTNKKLYITKPILNYVEVEMLKASVQKDFKLSKNNPEISVYDILQIISKHAEIKNEKALYEDLSQKMFGTDFSLNKGGKTLTELLDKNFIRLTSENLNWKEAIIKATEPLLEKGYVTNAYVDAMIASTEKIGPYIVLAPKVAVPHARPEEGVKKLGISLLQLQHPVDFNLNGEYDDDRMVQLIFVLAAVDNVSHLTALKQLSQILEEDTTIDEMIHAKNALELYEIINQYLENKEE